MRKKRFRNISLRQHKQRVTFGILLVRDPLPDPNRSRPVSISGSRYGVPLKWEPRANSDEPKTHRKENRKTPTADRRKGKLKRDTTSLLVICR